MIKRIIYVILLINAVFVISGCNSRNPIISIKTEMGNINVELYADRAPVTVANFLKYTDSSLFMNSCFYRVVRPDNQPHDSVKIEVIQGGRLDETGGFSPIIHETTSMTGVLHSDGVISMARLGPGSATSEFFICVGDQPSLDYGGKRNRDGQGFAAFGRVISGMEVVRRIYALPVPTQYLEKKVTTYNISRIK